MTTTKHQERKRNGQYGANFAAVCKCGHTLGEHMAEYPYDMDEGDHRCAGFEKAGRKPARPGTEK